MSDPNLLLSSEAALELSNPERGAVSLARPDPESSWEVANPTLTTDQERQIQEAEELKALFDLQHERSMEAIALWRAEDPENRELIQPDLGALLEWLMARHDAEREERLRLAATELLEHLDGKCYVYHGYSPCPAQARLREVMS